MKTYYRELAGRLAEMAHRVEESRAELKDAMRYQEGRTASRSNVRRVRQPDRPEHHDRQSED
jgi:hypothetical protein